MTGRFCSWWMNGPTQHASQLPTTTTETWGNRECAMKDTAPPAGPQPRGWTWIWVHGASPQLTVELWNECALSKPILGTLPPQVEWPGLQVYILKGKTLRNRNWQLPNSQGDVKYSTGNTVNNIVTTMCGAEWVLEISGGHFVKYMIT